MLPFTQTATAGFSDNRSQTGQAAQQLYQRAYTWGWLDRLWAGLTGQSRELLTLAHVEADEVIGNRYSAGLQTVPLNQIKGSQSRCRDFDRHFYPLHDHLAGRWIRVATAWYLGLELPPVELVQVGEFYFVRDGHHRISVAKAFGQTEILAEVRVWEINR
ncbi:MAG: hypothetical protein U0401_26590 [Anaerolineae bacterium]